MDKFSSRIGRIQPSATLAMTAKAAELKTAADTEYANQAYASSRNRAYPALAEQFDLLYHDIKAGKLGIAATTGNWYVGITSVKTAYPKP